MILFLSFEELAALSATAEVVLADHQPPGHGVAAPTRLFADIESFAQSLDGDLVLSNLDEQRCMQRVIEHLRQEARARMDTAVLELHPAAEAAVAAYFNYAHVLTVERRICGIGEEMTALIRLLTSDDPDSETARRFSFPE